MFLHLILLSMMSNIHLTSKDRLKGFQAILFPSIVDTFAIVKEFLDAKHVTVVGDSHAFHAISNGFVNEFLDT